MIFDGIDLYRAEGSETYVKCYMSDLNSHVLDLLQKLLCEMQTGCRGSCRALMFRVYSLIAVLIF